MSGSVQAILGNQVQGAQPIPLKDPLQMASSYQDLMNKKAQYDQTIASTANTQQNTSGQKQTQAQERYVWQGQKALSAAALPLEQQTPDLYLGMINDGVKTGTITPQEAQIYQQQIASTNGDPTKLQQLGIQHGLATLNATAQLNAASKPVSSLNTGGQTNLLSMPSQTQMLANPNSVPQIAGQMTNTQAPHYEATGSQLVPVGGANGAPTLNNTYSPGQGTDVQTRMVQQPDGSYAAVTKTLSQWNPGLAPAGAKPGASGGLGSGGYPAPPVTTMAQGQPEQLASDQKLYQEDKAAVPQLTTGTQSLGKALTALNAVASGAGTEGLARMRSLAVSLGNVVGVDTGGVNVQDMNRAELEKYLTDYARASGSAGRSDESLTAAFKSNASGSINNAAAQDVVRTNIGRDRQKIAAAMTAPNPQGNGYSEHKANYATQTDPRGFAWDTYTDAQKQQIIKEVQGSKGKDSPEYKKLARAVGDAQSKGMLNFSAPQPANVNSAVPQVAAPAPPVVRVPPPATAPSPLQGAPAGLNPTYQINPLFAPGA